MQLTEPPGTRVKGPIQWFFRLFRICAAITVSALEYVHPFRGSPLMPRPSLTVPSSVPTPKQPGQDCLLPHISLFRALDKRSPVARSSPRLLGSPSLSVRHRGAAPAAALLLWGLRWSVHPSRDIGGRSAFWRWGRTLLRPFPCRCLGGRVLSFPSGLSPEQVESLPAPLSRSCLTCPQRWPRLLARAGPHPLPCVSSLWLSSQG